MSSDSILIVFNDDSVELIVNYTSLLEHPDFAELADCLQGDSKSVRQIATELQISLDVVKRLCSKAFDEGYLVRSLEAERR